MRPNLGDLRSLALTNALRGCQLFSGLPTEDLESIASFVVQRRLEKGEYLFHEGDRSEGFYVVQTGAINVHRVSALGKEQVIHVFRAGQSFAEAAVATEKGYPADARAIEPSQVLLVPKADFVDLLRRRPDLALGMLGSMSQHLRVVVGLLDDLTLKDVETRLTHWLLKRCPQPLPTQPVTIELDRTKRVLAAELGTASETLSRTLAKFREQQLVKVDGKTISILSPRKLDQIFRRNLGEI
jgi:CRP/FNR family transcriptional regulator